MRLNVERNRREPAGEASGLTEVLGAERPGKG